MITCILEDENFKLIVLRKNVQKALSEPGDSTWFTKVGDLFYPMINSLAGRGKENSSEMRSPIY
jgi:hypothetical protein